MVVKPVSKNNFKTHRDATRRRMRELDDVLSAAQSLEAGHPDHLFANQETKDAMRADLMRQATGLIESESGPIQEIARRPMGNIPRRSGRSFRFNPPRECKGISGRDGIMKLATRANRRLR
jgi:hypothetical protein